MDASYDPFGNRTAQVSQGASCPALPSVPSPTVTYNAYNQVTWVQNTAPAGFGYDGAGNVTSDNKNVYAYDGEGRICAVEDFSATGGTVLTQYIYDAEGNRVAKGYITNWSAGCDTTRNGFTPTNSYVLGSSDEQLTETDGNGNWKHTNVYAAGSIIATYDIAPTRTPALHFQLEDWLGTRRVQTDISGCPEEAFTGLPFGDGLTVVPVAPCASGTADDATENHFTAKERDSESGNDYFGARYYASSMGRFMSPDFNDGDDDPDPVPYADIENPQSLNLYAYVQNNPLGTTDPNGHLSGCDGRDGNLDCNQAEMAFQQSQENGFLAQQSQQQQQLPHPVTTITVNGGDGGCSPSTDALCGMLYQSLLNNMRIPMQITATVTYAYFSKAHGKGERNQAGKASGTPNEEKVNKKARYDPKTKKWWAPDANGKRKDLGPGFTPTPDQIKKAGLAMTGVAAGAILSNIIEGAIVAAF